MGLRRTVSGDVVTIKIDGKFNFNLHRDFREAYKDTAGNKTSYVVDLAGTDYLDSSALGMLLLLREHAGGDEAKIQIINSSDEIRKIFDISNFNRLFDID